MQYHEIGKTGMKVSSLSFGASSLGGVFHDLKEKEGIQAVFTAVEAGMNFIDVSPYYGHYKAETVLGKALKDLPRDRYYLSTKVGRYGKDGVNLWDYSAKRATESVYESMERLNIDFIDLINVHDVEFADLNLVVNETLPALVELREKGVVGHVGVPAWHPAPNPLVEACRKAMEHCKAKNYPIEKLAMQFSVSNPRIATTLFSTTNPENVKKNIAFIEDPIDWELVREVQEIIGEQKRVSWANS